MIDLDLFCGAGGASTGLHRAGLEPIGVELWAPAARAHQAAGFPTIIADLATFVWPKDIRGRVRLLWASPPCQPFSGAGDGQGAEDGRDGIPHWLRAVAQLEPEVLVMENVPGLLFERHAGYFRQLVTRVRGLGYEVQWKVLDAADYGVPQHRERLFVIGRRDGGPMAWPAPTHSAQPGLFTLPHVTAAAAVGLEDDGSVIVTNHTTGAPDRRRVYLRSTSRPAPTLEVKSLREWRIRWPYERPATAICADPRLFTPGGHHANDGRRPGMPGRSELAIMLTADQAGALQGFPAGYPFQGTKRDVSRQIGNAVPPPVAHAIASALVTAGTLSV